MTAVFSVWNGESIYFPTKGEAVAYAKQVAAMDDSDVLDGVVEVQRCEVGLTGRELLCAALNGTGWVSDRTIVATIPVKGADQ